jgi:hypothetical protein
MVAEVEIFVLGSVAASGGEAMSHELILASTSVMPTMLTGSSMSGAGMTRLSDQSQLRR